MYLCKEKEWIMGQLAFLRMFILAAISIDANAIVGMSTCSTRASGTS